jgi:hypothetical protein
MEKAWAATALFSISSILNASGSDSKPGTSAVRRFVVLACTTALIVNLLIREAL